MTDELVLGVVIDDGLSSSSSVVTAGVGSYLKELVVLMDGVITACVVDTYGVETTIGASVIIAVVVSTVVVAGVVVSVVVSSVVVVGSGVVVVVSVVVSGVVVVVSVEDSVVLEGVVQRLASLIDTF